MSEGYVSDGTDIGYDFDSDVISWNQERGFLDKEFNLEKEMGYLLSETLESLDWNEIRNLNKDILKSKGISGHDYALENFSAENNLSQLVNIITKD